MGRLSLLYLLALAALYVGFLLYYRSSPAGTGSAAESGVLLLSGLFVAFALIGVVFTVTPAPRALEVASDHLVVVGRWGRRCRLPRIDRLFQRTVRRYSEGILASAPVALVEVWGEGVPLRSYLVSEGLFAGASASVGKP